MRGGEVIRGIYLLLGTFIVLSACLFAFSDVSDADSDVTVTGTVSVPDSATSSVSNAITQLTVAFVSDDDVKLVKAGTNGAYSVTLKADHTYTVSCYNLYRSGTQVIPLYNGTNMSYVFYSTIATGTEAQSYNITLNEGELYTDPQSGHQYYLYEAGFATLVKLNVEYEESTYNTGVQVVKNYHAKAGQYLVIPEYVEGHKVTFVGTSLVTGNYLGSVIQLPFGNPQTAPNNSTSYLSQFFTGPESNLLTIRFLGDVILNNQPFTAPIPTVNGSATSEKYNFAIYFDKDVTVNAYSQLKRNSTTVVQMTTVQRCLTALEELSIGGVFHGASYGNDGASPNTTILYQDLANTHINTITFDKDLSFYSGQVVVNERTSIDSLGILENSKLTVVSDEGNGFKLKNGETVTDCSVASYCENPISITAICGNDVSYVLSTKGNTKALGSPTNVPEGYEFGGWFKDKSYSIGYVDTEELNSNVVVYAKLVPKQYSIAISGDGFTVRNGDDAVANGSKIEFDTALTIVVENRIGYSATVKMDGVLVTGGTVKVPAKDFVISCEWAAIDYVVKCMDDETEVKAIPNCHIGDVVTLPAAPAKADMNFNGWKINGLLLGAQYVVDCRDAGEGDVITLTADYSVVVVNSSWALTVDGEGTQGKVFCTPTNAIGTYGMITVLPGEFERATYAVSANGGYGIISDNCVMVYSIDGKDVTVTVAFQDVGKASEYDVSIAEIASGEKHGFRATVTAENGYVDDAGEFKIRYVYKTWNADENLWIYATSGVTAGVDDEVITIAAGKSSFATGDFLLDKEGATLVFGYASYSFEGTVAGAAGTVTVTSPVIMSVSEIQAVVGRP